jgi:hypothetical protein
MNMQKGEIIRARNPSLGCVRILRFLNHAIVPERSVDREYPENKEIVYKSRLIGPFLFDHGLCTDLALSGSRYSEDVRHGAGRLGGKQRFSR